MYKKYLIVILSLFLISLSSGITLSENVNYNTSASGGDIIKFPMKLSLNSPETKMIYEQVNFSGSCGPWISLNRTFPLTVIEPQVIEATINIPNDSVGKYICRVSYISSEENNIRSSLSVPIMVRISGTDQNDSSNASLVRPTIVVDPVITPTVTISPTQSGNVTPPVEPPTIPMWTFGVAVVGVIVLLSVIFLITRYKNKEPDFEMISL